MKMKIKNILLFFVALSMTRCANVVAPTGGPKDVTPPKVKEAVPANHSTGFSGRKIEFSFDEYVTLNNASQQMLFSPLLKEKPDIKLSGKTVVIKFKEDLQPNTTYTLLFGEAVKDLHEGNLFKDYSYSFSTGDRLDTLTLAGKVLNADDQKPLADLFVTLYAAEDQPDLDSLFTHPTHRAPDFITKTDKNGCFSFNGLPEKSFLMFALNDMNGNYYYDMPNESVAFIDTLVRTTNDSVIHATNQNFTLYAFTVVDTTQMLLEKKLVDEGCLRFVFRKPENNANIVATSVLDPSFQCVEVWSDTHDTLCWYFTPNVMDSLKVRIEYDTVNEEIPFNLRYREPKQQRGKNTKALKVGSNLRNKALMPGEEFLLQFSEPVTELRLPDTVRCERVDDHGMRYRIVPFGNDSTGFVLNLSDSLFFSVRGRTNDSLSFKFKRAKETDFGNLFIQVDPPQGAQAVIQLVNSRDVVVDQQVVTDSVQRIGFTRLHPEKYKLKAIIDRDKNGKWSTGDFHRRFLPETTLQYKDELDIKAGWDIDLEEIWHLNP